MRLLRKEARKFSRLRTRHLSHESSHESQPRTTTSSPDIEAGQLLGLLRTHSEPGSGVLLHFENSRR